MSKYEHKIHYTGKIFTRYKIRESCIVSYCIIFKVIIFTFECGFSQTSFVFYSWNYYTDILDGMISEIDVVFQNASNINAGIKF